MRSLGLYIHIPFCKAKCIYCDFYSLPRAEGQMDAYVSALTAQLATWREHTADCTVDTVYFGGGTPSYLGPDRLCRLLDAVFQSYRVAPGAEITLETNPDSAQDISALRQLHKGRSYCPDKTAYEELRKKTVDVFQKAFRSVD